MMKLPILQKQLISVYFFKDRIQLLQLNPSKKKIERMASVSLPEGVVKEHVIQDSDSLASILKEAWGKLKIKEKTVGIVIPEFATFTKLITLPSLPTGDMAEAIDWQAKDFLPTGKEDMSMDWKEIGKQDDKLKVLVVAIKKQILSGYISAVDKAGLLPLVVETPSLSLSRLIGEEKQDSLIIYTLEGEGILVVSQNGGILGSSVVFNSDEEDILSTAKRIVKHFGIDVKKIFIAGDLAESKLTDSLNQVFGVVPVKMNLDIQSLKKEMLNEYLIPISLQFKQTFEPSDPRTVNLLPSFLVDRYKDKRRSIQVWGVTLTTTLFVWVSFLLVLTTFLFLSQQYNSENAKGTEKGSILQQRKQTLQKVNEVNASVQKVSAIKNIFIQPKKVLNEITSAGSENIDIQIYILDLDKGNIHLEGVSTDRSSLIEFKQNLENVENITSVNIPISSFEVEQDLEFVADIEYKIPKVNTQATSP